MERVMMVALVVALGALGVQAKTVAYWPLTYRNGTIDTRCAINAVNDFTPMAGQYVQGALPSDWNLPPNYEKDIGYMFTPTAYSSIGCLANGDGGSNGALLSNVSHYLSKTMIPTNSFTVEGWYYIPTEAMPGAWRIIMQNGRGSAAAGGWCLSMRYNSEGFYYYNFYIENGECSAGLDGGDRWVKKYSSISDIADQWNHVALVCTANGNGCKPNIKVYHNGELIWNYTYGAALNITNATQDRFEIGGRDSSNGQRGKFSYCNWRVSDKALSPEEFLNYDPLSQGGTVVPAPTYAESKTVAYWKLGKNADGTADLADRVGPANLDGGLFNAYCRYDNNTKVVTNTLSAYKADHACAFESNPPNGNLGTMGNHGSVIARQFTRVDDMSSYLDPQRLWRNHNTLIVPEIGDSLSPTNSFTVEGWLYPLRDKTMPNNGQQIICGTRPYGGDSVDGWTIKWNANYQQMVLYAQSDAHANLLYDSAMNDIGTLDDWSGWKHFALVYDCTAGNGTWTLYMDGVKMRTAAFSKKPTAGNSSHQFYLGGRPGDNQTWNGRYDCWRVTKRALSPKEFLCCADEDKSAVPNEDEDVMAIWPLNVLGLTQLDLRDVKGKYDLRDLFASNPWKLALDESAPTIGNPDVTSNFCGCADSTRGSLAFCQGSGLGTRSYLATTAYEVTSLFNKPAWTFETYAKRTSSEFNAWETLLLIMRQDYAYNQWPNLNLRFVYTKDNGFVLEDNMRIYKNNQAFGGKDLLEDGEWHHIALTYVNESDVITYKCYVDGTLVGTISYARTGNETSHHCVLFGGRPTSDNCSFHGCLSNIRLSSAALEPSDMLCANVEKPEKANAMLAYWPLESEDGVQVVTTNLVAGAPLGYDFFPDGIVVGSADRAANEVPQETFPLTRTNVGSATISYSASSLRSACYEVKSGESFTFEGWMKWSGNDIGVEKAVAGTYNSFESIGWRLSFIDGVEEGTSKLRLFAHAGGDLRSINVDKSWTLSGKTDIVADTWCHIGIVYNADDGRGVWTVYVNGKEVGTVENDWRNDMDKSETSFLYLGRFSTRTGCEKGVVGDFDMWRLTKGALDRTELLNFYVKGLMMLFK